MTLRDMKVGERASVTAVGGSGALRQHFLDMGIIPGTEITVIKYAPMGDPVEIHLHGYELTLRLADAAQIEVEAVTEEVKDKNKSHYPYQYTLQIGGMTCDNCARRVENALNSLPGAWANVDVSSEKAVLRMKEKTGEAQIKDAVASSGYTVLDIS